MFLDIDHLKLQVLARSILGDSKVLWNWVWGIRPCWGDNNRGPESICFINKLV